MKRRTSAKAVSIIGGADGPTSIFVAGRNKHKKRRLKERIKAYLYQKKREKIEAKITASPHTLSEVCRYIKKVYQAEELQPDERMYQEEYHSLRESLMLQYQPELLKEMGKIQKPKSLDEERLKAFWAQLEERSELVRAIPEEVFPLDFHIYQITLPAKAHPDKKRRLLHRGGAVAVYRGNLRVTIEKKYGLLACSYSGDKQSMKVLAKISRRIYLYYGVAQEDIIQKTERYQHLITALSS